MALSPPGIYSALSASRTAGVFPFRGVSFDQLAQGIANGVFIWGVGNPANLALQGVSMGTGGTGTILPVSTALLVPNATGAVLGAFLAAGMNGPLGQSLAPVVSTGISSVFSTLGRYSGVSAGVGAGADISKVVISNPVTLTTSLMSALSASFGGGGPALSIFASGLGNGIAALLLGGTGTGTVTGPASPTAMVGLTNSVVI